LRCKLPPIPDIGHLLDLMVDALAELERAAGIAPAKTRGAAAQLRSVNRRGARNPFKNMHNRCHVANSNVDLTIKTLNQKR